MRRFLILICIFIGINCLAQIPELIPYRLGNKWGFCNSAKEIIIQPKYDEVRFFVGDLAAVRSGINWGYVNKNGKVVIGLKYYMASDFDQKENGVAKISILKKVKYQGKNKKANKKECKELRKALRNCELTDDYKHVLINSSPCVMELIYTINNKGKFVERLDYEIKYPDGKRNYTSVRDGKKWVKKDINIPVIDKKGFDVFELSNQNMVTVAKGGKWGFADTSGKIIIDLKYDYVNPFMDGISIAQLGKGFVALDKSGQELFKYNDGILIEGFSNGLLLTKQINKDEVNYNRREKYGYLNKEGRFAIPAQFTNATAFYNGYSIVKDSMQKFHFMNTKGEFIKDNPEWEIPVECCTEYLGPVENIVQLGDLFKVRRKFSLPQDQIKENSKFQYSYKLGFISNNGNYVVPCEYDSVGRFTNGICKVTQNRKSGLINVNGNKVTELKYEELNIPRPFGCDYPSYTYKTILDYYDASEIYKYNLIKVVLNGKVGLIDFSGTEFFDELEPK